MRYLRHILVTLPLLASMILSSCIQELFPPAEPVGGAVEDGDYVTLDLSIEMMADVDQTIWTKALGEKPAVKDLYVAVFDAGDILTEIAKATPGVTVGDENDDFDPSTNPNDNYLTRFFVTLKKTAEPRQLQFIAIGKKDFIDVDNFDMVDEASFIKSFIVSDNVDAYWCRKAFPNGIAADNATRQAMQGLKMIRNFLKVTVSVANGLQTSQNNNPPVFTLSGFRVFNKPRYGTLAPYNPNTPEYVIPPGSQFATSVNFDRFADYSVVEIQEDTENLAYKELVEHQKYTGYMPSTVEYVSMNEAFAAEKEANPDNTWNNSLDTWFEQTMIHGDGMCDYLYECTYTDAANPFIIFKGSYNGGAETYYKADFVYHAEAGADKVYFHLLRNFFYELNITSVSSNGASSLEAAVNSPSMNNFDGSAEAQSYTVISKDSDRLYISATDHLVTSGTSVKVYLKNVKKNTTTGQFTDIDNSTIGISKITKCIDVKDVNRSEVSTPLISYAKGTYDSGAAAYQAALADPTILDSELTADKLESNSVFISNFAISQTNTNATFNGSSGWVEYTITLTKDPNLLADNEMWQQQITFSNGDGGLTRTLALYARKPYDFSVDAQDLVAKTEGTTMTVDIVLPSGISEARFPLKFLIEPYDHNLYPDATNANYPILPVVSGISLIKEKKARNERSYWFERTITYSEYSRAAEDIQSNKTFSSYFKTLVAESATRVYVVSDPVTSPYFVDDLDHQKSDSFVNDPILVVLQPEKPTLYVNVGAKAFNTILNVPEGAPLRYSTNNVAVATVNATTGEIIGVSAGTATITVTMPDYKAYTTNDVAATFTVIVAMIPDWSFGWEHLITPVVNRGKTIATNTAKAVVTNGTTTYEPTVTYVSSDEDVATVDANGVVTGVSAGTAVITAHAEVDQYVESATGITYSAVSEDIVYTIQVVVPGVSLPADGTEYLNVPFVDGKMLWFSPSTESGYPAWGWSSYGVNYGIQAQPYDGTDDHNSHSWLISDPIDMRAAVNPVLKFTHTGNYWQYGYIGDGIHGDNGVAYVAEDNSAATDRMMLQAQVKISFNGGAWVSVGLTRDEYPDGHSWSPKDVSHSLATLLNAIRNDQTRTDEQKEELLQNVRIGFEYLSEFETFPENMSNYRPWVGTWQIKNVRIVEQAE